MLDKKRALILGIGGQDGSYLAELLVEKGYEVHGFHRRSSSDGLNLWRIKHLVDRITLHRGDLLDSESLRKTIFTCAPDEIYNLADQDNIGWSFAAPAYSVAITAGAVGTILEILATTPRQHGNPIRLSQPISATVFSGAHHPQTLDSPLNPQSPYACAKVHAWHLCKHYREKQGVWVSCPIFYNHDSPRRTGDYLLQEVCRQAVDVKKGKREKILVGNLEAKVDVGFAGDYVAAAWLLLQHGKPIDRLVGTGELTDVLEICEIALGHVGFKNESLSRLVGVNPDFKRQDGIPVLTPDVGPISRIGWYPSRDLSWLIGIITKFYLEKVDNPCAWEPSAMPQVEGWATLPNPSMTTA